jgi:hypothetical protein
MIEVPFRNVLPEVIFQPRHFFYNHGARSCIRVNTQGNQLFSVVGKGIAKNYFLYAVWGV